MNTSAAIRAVAVHAFRLDLLADLQLRESFWRQQELQARVHEDDAEASRCHARATVLEELARDLILRSHV